MKFWLAVGGLALALCGSAQADPLPHQALMRQFGLAIEIGNVANSTDTVVVFSGRQNCAPLRNGLFACRLRLKYREGHSGLPYTSCKIWSVGTRHWARARASDCDPTVYAVS